MRTPIIEDLDVELYLPVPGLDTFQLDVSQLGTGRLADAATAWAWTPTMAKARSVTTTRGGQRENVSATIKVGTLNMTLVNAGEPTAASGIKPKVPIRLIHTGSGKPLYTGVILDIDLTYSLDRSTGETTTFVQIVAVDAVQDVANTPRYGAVVEQDDDGNAGSWEPWEDRIHRLMRSSSLPYTIPPAGSLVRDEVVRLREDYNDLDDTAPPEGWERPGRHVGQSWFPHRAAGFWFPEGTCPANTPLMTYAFATVPGRRYRLSALVARSTGDVPPPERVNLGIDGIGSTTTEILPWFPPHPAPDQPMVRVEFTFTATLNEHAIAWSLPSVYEHSDFLARPSVLFDDLIVTEIIERDARGLDWMCSSIVYESNLANHLDLACNTVRAVWWIDAAGMVHFLRELDFEDAKIRFSDRADPNDPLHWSYLDISGSYDTRALVNNLELENHGRAWDEDAGAYQADDTTRGPYIDNTSTATYGPRLQSVSTSLWSPPYDPGSVFYRQDAALAASYLADYAPARFHITDLRLNAREDPDRIAALDIYDAVTVRYREHNQTSSVLAIEHDIEPDRWTTTLHLIERRTSGTV